MKHKDTLDMIFDIELKIIGIKRDLYWIKIVGAIIFAAYILSKIIK